MTKTSEFIKWMHEFIKDKDNLNSTELAELKDKLSLINNGRVFNITLTEVESTSKWKSNMSFPPPIFKNPYNYEITEVDKKYNKK